MLVEDTEFQPYHGKPKRGSQYKLDERYFIAWDGEGINLDGPGRPQSYVLFGCSTGQYIESDKHLHTFELLDFILSVAQENPAGVHVGYAFGYDSNMLVRSLSENALRILHTEGRITLKRHRLGSYHIQYRPGKWFSVTRYGTGYDRETNPHDKMHAKIYDMFGFFAKSFVSAYEKVVGPVPDVVREGKKLRNEFADISREDIKRYWSAEIEMMRELAERLREHLYDAGLFIRQWHGPGALANYAMREHHIDKFMAVTPEPVREAAKYAYAGGRFEMFKLGRTTGPIYSVDINSAYPHGISQLPCLASGVWTHNPRPSRRIARFGVYRVRLLPYLGGSFLERAPGPLFHRDSLGNISFPWVLDGWYWSPEVKNLFTLAPGRFEIIEGWEYTGGYASELPFHWVPGMYRERRELKAAGHGSELALKLCMNSLYGKMAQRVGWNEELRRPPKWHQLEWAGWVTSNTRAMLWQVMAEVGFKNILAVETDGLYMTVDPSTVGIEKSDELGGWSVDVYDEILYVQSGMAWLRAGDKWTCKRRGLDMRTFELQQCADYLQTLNASTYWEPYMGQTTRFVGLGAALNSKAPTKVRHCVWETKTRDISPGHGGKRIHVHGQCGACSEGLNAYDGAHDMSIRSLAYKDPASYPHDIPWDGDPEAAWRVHDGETIATA
jgi:hypothetical protein